MATQDSDILLRLRAKAEQKGLPNPQQFAEQNIGALVSVDIGGTTLSDVLAYKNANYVRQYRPGEDPTAVTDDQLGMAIDKLYPPTPPVEQVDV